MHRLVHQQRHVKPQAGDRAGEPARGVLHIGGVVHHGCKHSEGLNEGFVITQMESIDARDAPTGIKTQPQWKIRETSGTRAVCTG